MRVLDHLIQSIRQASAFNQDVEVAPACILWPDKERQWESVARRLLGEIPELLILGEYAPEKRTGPAIWLRCVIAGKLDDILHDKKYAPIIYLPGIGRQDLRAVESCPDYLKPLAELQYRGTIWSQINAKDWTPLALLKSDQGGLGLDVAQDGDTKNAIRSSLPRLLDEEVSSMRGKRLDKNYFNKLLSGGDPVRDVLQWLDQEEMFRESREDSEWKAFIEICKSEFAFNPRKEGPLGGALKLASREGVWQTIWNRYCEAPTRYPNVPAQIRKCKAPDFDLFADAETAGGWPQWNETQEKSLFDELKKLSNVAPHDARDKVIELDKQHGKRRELVWAELGESPLVCALEYLRVLAETTKISIAAGTVEDITTVYLTGGWGADDAVLKALEVVDNATDLDVVITAIRVMYLPWVEESAKYLQKLTELEGYPGGTIENGKSQSYKDGDCILFVDGLRIDIAKRLEAMLGKRRCAVGGQSYWAALPTVTATGKPAITPVRAKIYGQEANIDFEPEVKDTGQSLKGGYHLKKLMKDDGWVILDKTETGNGEGKAWCEFGSVDDEGHDRGARLAKHIDPLLKEICDKVNSLLDAGWKNVHIVTDHGWLLMPGGLPKTELPKFLTENRSGRCAAIKEGAQVKGKTYPWYWNPNQHFVLADGVSCFYVGKEYAHGGISLQECLLLRMTVQRTKAEQKDMVEITDIVWRGLRCKIAVDGEFKGLFADIRTRPGDPSTSVVLSVKSFDEKGMASVVIDKDEYENTEATVVILNSDGKIITQSPTVIGESNNG